MEAMPRSKQGVIRHVCCATASLMSCHPGPLLRADPPLWCTLFLSLVACLQGLRAANLVCPSPLLAPSYSQWTVRPIVSSDKTSTLPWDSSTPTRRAAIGTACDVSVALCYALYRGIVNRLPRCPPWSTAHLYTPWVAAPRATVALPSQPSPVESWNLHPPACSARRPHVVLRSRRLIFVSSHHGHARGTQSFSSAPSPIDATPILCVPPVASAPLFATPSQRLAGAGHPRPFRCSQSCFTAQRRRRTPHLLASTLVEAAPCDGDRSPCF